MYCMRGSVAPGHPEQDFWSGGVFEEVKPTEKIVLTDSFTDKNGNFVPPSAYGMDTMPEHMHVTLLFQGAGDGKTKLTISYAEDIPQEHSKNMLQGWNESLDKLEEVVKNG